MPRRIETAAMEALRRAVGHPLAAGLLLAGSAFVFTGAPGSIEDFMAAGGGLFVLNLAVGCYRPEDATEGHIAAVAVIGGLAFFGAGLPGVTAHSRSLRYLLLTPGMIMLWHAFSRQAATLPPRVLTAAAVGTLCACVTLQAMRVRFPGEGGPFGYYDNPHHLGLFASLALILLAWTAMRLDGWRRALTAPWMLAATYLLWQSGSRISWLVFFSSLLLAVLLFLPRRQIAGVLGAGFAASAAGAWFSGVAAIAARVKDLHAHFWSDERWEVWPAALRLLGENTPREWLFGHGIGNFRLERIRVSAADDFQTYAFPHNAALQLLYENGAVGLAIVSGGAAALFWALWRSRRRPSGFPADHASAVLFALLAVLTGHCLLTKSVYSKYTLYAFSLVIGASLVRLENAGFLKPWKTRWKRYGS